MNNNKNQRDGSAETDIKSKRGLPFQKDQEDERRAKGAYPFFGGFRILQIFEIRIVAPKAVGRERERGKLEEAESA
jgi:hypothetical protein